jgi:trimeric autotransporter adhesin
MNSLFKFLRRVRIHGGESGAVARALRHEVKGLSLCQADSRKSLGSTNERKSMSTKTTLKRIALVAVSALGAGVLSIVAAPTANAVASSLSVEKSSLTVVQDASPTAIQNLGAYRFTVLDADGLPTALASDETITVSITAAPTNTSIATAPALTDFLLAKVVNYVTLAPETGMIGHPQAVATVPFALNTGATVGVGTNSNTCSDSSAITQDAGKYCVAVQSKTAALGLNSGTYTLRADLTRGAATLSRLTLSFKLVSSAADSGALITVATAGQPLVVGKIAKKSATEYIRATLTDANGGRLVTSDTTSTSTISPTPVGYLETAAGAELQGLIFSDTATAFDYSPTAGATANDGVYGVTLGDATLASAAQTYAATLTSSSASLTAASTVRVRYGIANATASVTVLAAPTAVPNVSSRSVSATGIYTTTETTTASNAQTYYVPTSTTSVSITITARTDATTVVASAPITFTTTWAANNAGSVTPVSGATGATTVITDANGTAKFTLTQTSPLAGSSATVAITGASDANAQAGAGFGTVTISWPEASTVASISITPNATFKVAASTAYTVTATPKDVFGATMGAGVILQPSLSSTSANYSTTAIAPVTTDASGNAVVTLAGGATATSNVLTFTHVPTAVAASRTISHITTVPVITTLTGGYNVLEDATAFNAFSTTTIGAAAPLTINKALNYSQTIAAITTVATDSRVKFRIAATDAAGAVTGVPVTLTVTSGGHMLDSCDGSAAKPVTTRVCYPDASGYVFIQGISTGTGTITYTATAGTVTASQSIVTTNAATDARYVALSGTESSMKATVTDRFGNAVEGASVQISVTGATLGGGASANTFSTLADGSINFNLAGDADGSATVTAKITTASTDASSLAGYSGSSVIDSTVTAGVSQTTATVAVSGSSAKAAAEAASDAAAEAIDSANAATDAANLAAEAADAATVAAEEARDAADAATAAIEELATQVATLMASLKAQITTLANVVAKIAKRTKS